MFRSVRVRLRERGLYRTLLEGGWALWPTTFEVWKKSLRDLTPEEHPGTLAVRAEAGNLEHLRRLRRYFSGLPADFYRDEIDGARHCVVAEAEGRLAGVAWCYDRHHPGHYLSMGPGDAEVRSVYSLPEFRGKGVAKAVVREACHWLSRNGYERAYAVIHCRNIASKRAFAAAGFTKVATLRRPALIGPRFRTQHNRS